jgi:hypothetical protein
MYVERFCVQKACKMQKRNKFYVLLWLLQVTSWLINSSSILFEQIFCHVRFARRILNSGFLHKTSSIYKSLNQYSIDKNLTDHSNHTSLMSVLVFSLLFKWSLENNVFTFSSESNARQKNPGSTNVWRKK